jgi:hypothetical protein
MPARNMERLWGKNLEVDLLVQLEGWGFFYI